MQKIFKDRGVNRAATRIRTTAATDDWILRRHRVKSFKIPAHDTEAGRWLTLAHELSLDWSVGVLCQAYFFRDKREAPDGLEREIQMEVCPVQIVGVRPFNIHDL